MHKSLTSTFVVAKHSKKSLKYREDEKYDTDHSCKNCPFVTEIRVFEFGPKQIPFALLVPGHILKHIREVEPILSSIGTSAEASKEMGQVLVASHTVDQNSFQMQQPDILLSINEAVHESYVGRNVESGVGMALLECNEVAEQNSCGIIQFKRRYLHHALSGNAFLAEVYVQEAL